MYTRMMLEMMVPNDDGDNEGDDDGIDDDNDGDDDGGGDDDDGDDDDGFSRRK